MKIQRCVSPRERFGEEPQVPEQQAEIKKEEPELRREKTVSKLPSQSSG